MVTVSLGPLTVTTVTLSPDPRANSGCIGSNDPRPFLGTLSPSLFRRILLGVKLLLRRQPSFQLLSRCSVENLQDDSGHSFRVRPSHMALPTHARSLRQIKREIHDRRAPQPFRGAHGHSAFAQVGHARMLFHFPFLRSEEHTSEL